MPFWRAGTSQANKTITVITATSSMIMVANIHPPYSDDYPKYPVIVPSRILKVKLL